MMLPPPKTGPAVTKDADAEDERVIVTALFKTSSPVDTNQPSIAKSESQIMNESPVNTSSSSSSVVDNDEKDMQSPRLRDNDKGKALVQPSSSGLLATTSPRKRKSSTVIRRDASSNQFSETKSESKSSASSSERQRKKAATGKTATQKSVLRSKIAFFMFLVTVAAVAGGKSMNDIFSYKIRFDLSILTLCFLSYLFHRFVVHIASKNGTNVCKESIPIHCSPCLDRLFRRRRT